MTLIICSILAFNIITFIRSISKSCYFNGFISAVEIQIVFLSRQKQSSTSVLIKKCSYKKVCSNCVGEQPCRSVISIKLLCNFIEITFWHRCSPVNLLHILRTAFSKNTSGVLFLNVALVIMENEM